MNIKAKKSIEKILKDKFGITSEGNFKNNDKEIFAEIYENIKT